MRVAYGVASIYALSYYDKLQRSVIQAYGQRSAQVPKQMRITPIWANMGVFGPEDTEKVDNCRVDKLIRKSVRDFAINSIRSKSLTFDLLKIVDPTTDPTTAAPTVQMNKFLQICPTSAESHPYDKTYWIC